MKEISVKDLKENFIDMIANEWMLVTAADKESFNTMTASWGFVGEMWGKDCAVCGIRPQRYTFDFIDKADRFTLSFYGEQKQIHAVCGSKSGRDTDKCKEAGLTPVVKDGIVYFEQARIVLVCKKIYTDWVKPENFVSDELDTKWYPNKDYHKLFIGEIETVLVNQ